MRFSTGLSFLLLVLLLSVPGGCRKTENEPETTGQTATPIKPAASPLTGFEADLQYVKNGSYTYIWVFSRKDGKALDKEDSAFLRTNAPQVVDWVTTDGGKKVIAGTNFNLEEGNLNSLRKRFVTEDYSGK
jgi:hypothetical protein